MVDPRPKSRKRSSGNSDENSPESRRPKKYSFYLDADTDATELREEFDRRGIKYRRYCDDVSQNAATEDVDIYPHAAQRACIFLTSDSRQRFRGREPEEIRRYKLRHFVLPSKLGGRGLAQLVIDSKNAMFDYCRKHDPPFSVSIDRKGKLHPRSMGEDRVEKKQKQNAKAVTQVE
jgi:hypothetical protein